MAGNQSNTVARRKHALLLVALMTSAAGLDGMVQASPSRQVFASHHAFKGSAFVATPTTISSFPLHLRHDEYLSMQRYNKGFLIDTSSTTKLQMSSSSPPRRSYSPSTSFTGRKKRSTSSSSSSQQQQNQQSRNRGANAANRNRRGHAFRLEGLGDQKPTRARKSNNTKRAPRWEREGDKLYAEVTKQLDALFTDENASEELLTLAKQKQITTAQDVCRLLEPWVATEKELEEVALRNEHKRRQSEESKNNNSKESSSSSSSETETTTPESNKQPKKNIKSPPFMWGALPVGPVLASRLNASERPTPTSVQRAAFPILTAGNSKKNKKGLVPTKRTNAIIASPTGTGKTLAYILPLLCTSPGGQAGEGTGGVLIVTPTIELACQIQREVDALWPRSLENNQSSMFVVGADEPREEMNAAENKDAAGDEMSPGRITLRSIPQNAPLIAGTPKMLRMLYRDAERVTHDLNIARTITKQEKATARALLSNLRAIVLDEADRLLRTEAVAREQMERKQRKIAERKREEAEAEALDNYIPPPPKPKKKRLIIARQTQTEFLLRDLPIPSLNDLQIICASATIGRTMRRQLMQILDATSADAAATLITGDEDERVKSKDAERRKSVLLPEKLRHAYRVVEESSLVEDEGDLTNDTTTETMSTTSEINEEKRVTDTISTLWDTMMSMEESKPIIVFPGRVGVERVQKELIARGLDDVRTLRNLDGLTPEADIEIDPSMTQQQHSFDHDWKSTPVYIIGERFARGLDLPEVEYVFMLSPPSSAAGYAHMAGRTGRRGLSGTAVTLVRPKNNEVQRLAAIAEALGLKFTKSMSGVGGEGKIEESTMQDSESADSSGKKNDEVEELPEQDTDTEVATASYPWKDLSEAALMQKKNAELYDYLVGVGESINKRSKKAELVSAIQLLHSSI